MTEAQRIQQNREDLQQVCRRFMSETRKIDARFREFENMSQRLGRHFPRQSFDRARTLCQEKRDLMDQRLFVASRSLNHPHFNMIVINCIVDHGFGYIKNIMRELEIKIGNRYFDSIGFPRVAHLFTMNFGDGTSPVTFKQNVSVSVSYFI